MTTARIINAVALGLLLASLGCEKEAPAPAPEPVQAEEPVPADQAFIDAMVPHQERAIGLAHDAINRASQSELKEFASKLVDDRTRQIAQLRGWREEWFGSDETPVVEKGPVAAIPSGPEFDRQWVQHAITHHQQAIDLAGAQLQSLTRPELKTFAQGIIDEQTRELEQLRAFEEARAEPAPPTGG